MRKITAVQLRARQARLEQLCRGLGREYNLWIGLRGQEPLNDEEHAAYLGAVQQAQRSLATAAVIVGKAAHRGVLEEDRRKSGLSKREG